MKELLVSFTVKEIEDIGLALGELELKVKEAEKVFKILSVLKVKYQEALKASGEK